MGMGMNVHFRIYTESRKHTYVDALHPLSDQAPDPHIKTSNRVGLTIDSNRQGTMSHLPLCPPVSRTAAHPSPKVFYND